MQRGGAAGAAGEIWEEIWVVRNSFARSRPVGAGFPLPAAGAGDAGDGGLSGAGSGGADSGGADSRRQKGIAVGTPITERPPHRTVRAAFPHTAPTLGV